MLRLVRGSVRVADHGEVLRLLAKRNHEIGRLRNIIFSRLHAALQNLSPGGIAKELNASDAIRLLDDSVTQASELCASLKKPGPGVNSI